MRSRTRVALALTGLLAACQGTPRLDLSGQDRDDLSRVTAYLDAMPRFEAHFTQTGAFGPGAGLVWLDRPGHLRLDYAGAASRVMVIANGRVSILDRATGALTTQPLSRTPLGILLAPHIQLDGPVTVTALVHGGTAAVPELDLTVAKTGAAGQGSLTLALADRPLRLLGVSVTDPYGRLLTLGLSGIDTGAAMTPGLFLAPRAGS